MNEHFTITKTLKRRVPVRTRHLRTIKTRVLGKKYILSLVFIGDRRSQTLNKIYRNKNKPTNVLSFPLTNTEGELFINVPLAYREARKAGVSVADRIIYLFIHGTLHLKGLRHGATMDAEEQRLSKAFLEKALT